MESKIILAFQSIKKMVHEINVVFRELLELYYLLPCQPCVSQSTCNYPSGQENLCLFYSQNKSKS